jgi:integrase
MATSHVTNPIPPTRIASSTAVTGTVVKQRRRYLLQYSVLPSTQQRYNRSVDAFLEWVNDEGEDAFNVDELDELLLDYIHHLYEDGRGRTVASTTIYGILLRMPQLKYQLHASHQAIRAWNRLTPDKSYPPLTWELAVVIAVQMARAGYHRYGIGVLIAFDGLLRVSELCNIMISDIADDGDDRIGMEHKGMLLHLRSTKTGKHQWVQLRDPSVIRLVRWLLRQDNHQPAITVARARSRVHTHVAEVKSSVTAAPHTAVRRSTRRRVMSSIGVESTVYDVSHCDLVAAHKLLSSPVHRNNQHRLVTSGATKHSITSSSSARSSDVRLFPFATYQFRRIFKAVCANLGLSDRYVPHSLRHGGATRYHHIHGWSIEDVLARGRWQSVKSARRYIQSGVAMLMTMQAPKNINDMGMVLIHDPYYHLITNFR